MDMNKILEYVEKITENLGDLIEVIAESYEEGGAIYVDDEQNVKFISMDEAVCILDNFGKDSESVMIGNSDYILIYDAEKKIVIDGDGYIPSGYVVMKSSYGLQPIDREETDAVMTELLSRMATLVCGKYRMQAYQLG